MRRAHPEAIPRLSLYPRLYFKSVICVLGPLLSVMVYGYALEIIGGCGPYCYFIYSRVLDNP